MLGACSVNDKGTEDMTQNNGNTKSEDPREILSSAIEKFETYQNFTIVSSSDKYPTKTTRCVNHDGLAYTWSESIADGEQQVSFAKYQEKMYDAKNVEYVDDSKKQVKYLNPTIGSYGPVKWNKNYFDMLLKLNITAGVELKDALNYFDIDLKKEGNITNIKLSCRDFDGFNQAVMKNLTSYLPESEDSSKYSITYTKSEANFVLNEQGDITDASLTATFNYSNGEETGGDTTYKISKINESNFDYNIYETIEQKENPWEQVYDLK